MPTLVEEQTPAVRVAPSAVLELMWVLHFIESGHEHEGAFAALEPLRHRFGRQLSDLRADGMPQYSTELVVLAQRSGTLLDLDLRRFFDRLDKTMSNRSELPSLRSEKPAERKIVRERLERLRTDSSLRRRYAELVTTAWVAVEAEWQREGRAAVVAEAERWTRALDEQSVAYKTLLGLTRLWPGRPELDEIADTAATEGKLI